MHRIILAAALVAASTVIAKADTVYVGNTFIDVVSGPASCTSTFKVGDFFRAAFRPRGAALGNGADSYLTLVGGRAAVTMLVPNNNFQQGVNYSGRAVTSSLTLGVVSGGVTVWNQTGANGAATVKIRGRFSNFFLLSGCFVEVRGILLKR